ncbi:MAG: hypothetical protein RL483_839 [Pseudomonadota bacterium]|jgi:exodeoxyribonuclease VII large subunit
MQDPGFISVSELNRLIAQALSRHFPAVSLQAEVSQLTVAASGHWYLTLKDAQASVKAVMFRREADLVGFVPSAGTSVELVVAPGLYEPRGEFQVRIVQMRRVGQGGLYEAFLRLKQKLETEGLFDPGRKRAWPTRLAHVGVVTSLSAAALRDFLITLRQRAPRLKVTILASLVQGQEAPGQLVRALERAGQLPFDALAVIRGGGSLEDLWAFNTEEVVRAVSRLKVPVVSGVGHETDVTLVDFVADHRAATPTAAAAWLARGDEQAMADLQAAQQTLKGWMLTRLRQAEQRLDRAQAGLPDPRKTMRLNRLRFEQSAQALALARQRWQTSLRHQIQRLADQLDHLGPTAVLARGYAMVMGPDGQVLTSVVGLQPKSELQVVLSDGEFSARVETLSAQRRI